MSVADPPVRYILRILDEVAASNPDLWMKLYPRRYEVLGSYDTPKAASYTMLDSIARFMKGGKETEQAEALWTAAMVLHRVPLYYIARDLTEALLQTRAGTEVDWAEMKMPHEAAVFMLPKGSLPHKTCGEVSFIGYSRTFAGDELPLPLPDRKTFDFTCMNTNLTIIVRLSEGFTLHWMLDPSVGMVDPRDVMGSIGLASMPAHTSAGRLPGMDDEDTAVMIRAVELLFNILLFMASKPQMVEMGAMLKRVHNKRDGRPLEYWTPHVIGRSYKLRRIYDKTVEHGHHSSPRGHWVSGFWREQPHGEGRTLRRTLWIEPFWRGGA